MTAAGEIVAFGSGKVILLGEHGAVYGHPAIAAPLSRGVTARGRPANEAQLDGPETLSEPSRHVLEEAFRSAALAAGAPRVRVTLQSDLPWSMGLGSSAAVSVACARLLLKARNGIDARSPDVARLAFEMEKVFHGFPSGIDHTCSAEGTLIHFRREPGSETPLVRRLNAARPLKIVVALVGDRTSTKETVALLRKRHDRWPDAYARLFKEIAHVVEEGTAAIEKGDLDALGERMNINHGLLAALGLSSARIDRMVHRLRDLGALGAKLTGAGGDGGAVIGLFAEPDPAVSRLEREGVRCFGDEIVTPPRKQ